MAVASAPGKTDTLAPSRTLSPDDLPHPTSSSTHATTSLTPHSQRGRSTSRYPDSLGRVPLHRRGTSKTYERLEDLLREAGYKETRVFTPENDRDAHLATEKHNGDAGNSVRESVGAVVGFITGLVSRGSSLSRDVAPSGENATLSMHAWTPPASPLAHVLSVKENRPLNRVSSIASLSRKGSSDSIPRCSHVGLSADGSGATHQASGPHQPSQGLPHHLRPHRHHNSHHHLHHQLNNNYSSNSLSTKTNPPNARAYLRHMASAPNIHPIAKRPSLSEASLRSHALGRDRRNGARRMIILNDEDSITESDCEPHSRGTMDDNEHQGHPPLPRNWLETVTKTLLSTVAGPVTVISDAASARTVKTASTRKSTALSDKSNKEDRGRVLAQGAKPPLLCVQVRDVKARTSEGQVACTRVTCRSTPTSRANSQVRGACDDRVKARSGGKRRDANNPGNWRRGADRGAHVVPSLARTKVENDTWMAPRHHYSAGWNVEGSAQAYSSTTWLDESDGEDEDEDEEEGELGLDRLLVPARRQHSIQSLRKHLQRPPFGGPGTPHPKSPRSGRVSPFGETSTGRLDWRNASWSTSRGREWLMNQDEEGEDGHGYVYAGAVVGKSTTKWRRGLPGLAQWTTSS